MKKPDGIDTDIHYDWRPGRLQILGVRVIEVTDPKAKAVKGREFIDKLEPKERLGKLRGTLGSVKEERDGASYSTFAQRWPEFRNENGILIQRAFLAMTGHRRKLMDARYTWVGYFSIEERIESMGMAKSSFWQEIGALKAFIEGFMAVHGGEAKKYLDTELSR